SRPDDLHLPRVGEGAVERSDAAGGGNAPTSAEVSPTLTLPRKAGGNKPRRGSKTRPDRRSSGPTALFLGCARANAPNEARRFSDLVGSGRLDPTYENQTSPDTQRTPYEFVRDARKARPVQPHQGPGRAACLPGGCRAAGDQRTPGRTGSGM